MMATVPTTEGRHAAITARAALWRVYGNELGFQASFDVELDGGGPEHVLTITRGTEVLRVPVAAIRDAFRGRIVRLQVEAHDIEADRRGLRRGLVAEIAVPIRRTRLPDDTALTSRDELSVEIGDEVLRLRLVDVRFALDVEVGTKQTGSHCPEGLTPETFHDHRLGRRPKPRTTRRSG